MKEVSSSRFWGIDLGGTKIEGVILDPSHPDRALHRLRVPTESANGYDHILGQFSKLISLLEEVSGTKCADRIGVGTPGVTTSGTGLLKNSNTVCLNGKPLAADLSRVIDREAILANDANCCGLPRPCSARQKVAGPSSGSSSEPGSAEASSLTAVS